MSTLARLLEVSHVAHRLGASQEYVRQLIRGRRLAAIRLGSRWRVDPVDLQGFIDLSCHTTTAQTLMPNAPKRPCVHPGCPRLIDGGTRGSRCPAHAKAYDLQRGSSRARGYDSRWAAFSRDWRQRYPLCGMRADGQLHAEHSQCVQQGLKTPAQCVDHIRGHKDDPQHQRFYDEDRLQSLCLRCNNRKRALEEGGFGRGGVLNRS